jgi:putative transposase
MHTICNLFGYTRQAWYKGKKHEEATQVKESEILRDIKEIRNTQPKLGTVKLLKMIRDKHSRQVIGRDALYQLLRLKKLLVKPRKVYRPQMTNGNGESIYPDLRKELKVDRINQLWSCDITYFWLKEENVFCYATLVVDEHSHLIVGHHVSRNMTAEETLKAVKRGVSAQQPKSEVFEHPLVFHTDRGGQFKSALFQQYFEGRGILTSMCRAGKSSENPVAERLNGILKGELICGDEFKNFEEAEFLIGRAIEIYNEQRPHLSCGLLTPKEAHQPGVGVLKKFWRQRKPKKHN